MSAWFLFRGSCMVQKKHPLAVFDMDGVLVYPRSSWRVVHDALGTSNEHSFELYMEGKIDDEEFMARDIALWKGVMERPDVDTIRKMMDNVPIMNGFDEALDELKGNGIETVIISGGLDILADRLMDAGGFSEYHANGFQIGAGGEIHGKGILRVPLRDKGSVLKQLIKKGYGPIAAVGDSFVDVPMFRLADLSIAFRPESREVSSEADHVVSEDDLTKVSDIIITDFNRLRER